MFLKMYLQHQHHQQLSICLRICAHFPFPYYVCLGELGDDLPSMLVSVRTH